MSERDVLNNHSSLPHKFISTFLPPLVARPAAFPAEMTMIAFTQGKPIVAEALYRGCFWATLNAPFSKFAFIAPVTFANIQGIRGEDPLRLAGAFSASALTQTVATYTNKMRTLDLQNYKTPLGLKHYIQPSVIKNAFPRFLLYNSWANPLTWLCILASKDFVNQRHPDNSAFLRNAEATFLAMPFITLAVTVPEMCMNKSLIRQIAIMRGLKSASSTATKRSVLQSTLANLKSYPPRTIFAIFGLRILWKTIENGLSMFGALELQMWLAKNADKDKALLHEVSDHSPYEAVIKETKNTYDLSQDLPIYRWPYMFLNTFRLYKDPAEPNGDEQEQISHNQKIK